MLKFYRILVSACILFVTSCSSRFDLTNSKWRAVKFSVESSNYLSELDKSVYLSFDTSTKLYAKFTDTLVLTFVEGAAIDTSVYKVKNDTLFFIQGSRRDTSLILKISKDSLIEQRLAGVRTYSIRVNE